MEEWGKILQGGGILGGIALAAKLILPVLSKQSEASTSRLETDATLHDLYQRTLVAQRELAEALNLAREEIGALKMQVISLTNDLTNARNLLAKAEESLAAQANKSANLEV